MVLLRECVGRTSSFGLRLLYTHNCSRARRVVCSIKAQGHTRVGRTRGLVRHCHYCLFFFSSRRRHTRFDCDWSSDVCSSDLINTFNQDTGGTPYVMLAYAKTPFSTGSANVWGSATFFMSILVSGMAGPTNYT